MTDVQKSLSGKPLGALLSIIGRNHYIVINDRLKQFGLSAGQFSVLMCLIQKQNIIQDTLARHFHIDKGAVARSVRKLVDSGYVQRNTDPENRRAVRLFLTGKGIELTPAVLAIARDWEEVSFTGFSEGERRECMEFLRRIAVNCLTIHQKTGD